MLAKDKDWARGYAKQALSDLDAREILVRGNAENVIDYTFFKWQQKKCAKHT
jgi:hypothetical protein